MTPLRHVVESIRTAWLPVAIQLIHAEPGEDRLRPPFSLPLKMNIIRENRSLQYRRGLNYKGMVFAWRSRRVDGVKSLGVATDTETCPRVDMRVDMYPIRLIGASDFEMFK